MRCKPDCTLRRTMLSYHTALSRGAITQWYHSVYSITQCYHAVPSRSAITQWYHSAVMQCYHAVLSLSNHAVLTQCYHAAQSRSAITRCHHAVPSITQYTARCDALRAALLMHLRHRVVVAAACRLQQRRHQALRVALTLTWGATVRGTSGTAEAGARTPWLTPPSCLVPRCVEHAGGWHA